MKRFIKRHPVMFRHLRHYLIVLALLAYFYWREGYMLDSYQFFVLWFLISIYGELVDIRRTQLQGGR